MMKYYWHTFDHQTDLDNLDYFESVVPMTRAERTAIRRWVYRGNSVDSNPWNYLDSDGEQMCYLQAYRLKCGYTHGPWDYWFGDR